jgi:hypothetical protein
VKLTNELSKRVNSIISKYSPVHIIQKYIRGFLDRRYFKEEKDMQLWAAIKIQKWWRKLKKYNYKAPKVRESRRSVLSNLSKQSVSFHTSSKPSNELLFPTHLPGDFINEKVIWKLLFGKFSLKVGFFFRSETNYYKYTSIK